MESESDSQWIPPRLSKLLRIFIAALIVVRREAMGDYYSIITFFLPPTATFGGIVAIEMHSSVDSELSQVRAAKLGALGGYVLIETSTAYL